MYLKNFKNKNQKKAVNRKPTRKSYRKAFTSTPKVPVNNDYLKKNNFSFEKPLILDAFVTRHSDVKTDAQKVNQIDSKKTNIQELEKKYLDPKDVKILEDIKEKRLLDPNSLGLDLNNNNYMIENKVVDLNEKTRNETERKKQNQELFKKFLERSTMGTSSSNMHRLLKEKNNAPTSIIQDQSCSSGEIPKDPTKLAKLIAQPLSKLNLGEDVNEKIGKSLLEVYKANLGAQFNQDGNRQIDAEQQTTIM